jgi:AcrR family transcriptional regulator
VSSAPGRSRAHPPPSAVPPQLRGRTRRAHIVRAASDLIDAADPSERRPVTLRAIAEAADIPPASIYHYFADVDSVIAAVAAQYGQELVTTVELVMAGHTGSIDSLLDATVTTYRDFFAARPGLRELWFDWRASDQVVDIHRKYRRTLAEGFRARIERTPAAADEALAYAALFEMSGRLWEMAFELDPAGHPRVLAEIHEIAQRFFCRLRGIPPPPSGIRARGRLGPEPGRAGADGLRPRDRCSSCDREPRLPPQARGRKRRAQILAAASEIIDTHGPHATDLTIRAIADAAGTSPASIYHYFEDLESLVAAVAADYMGDLVALSAQVGAEAGETEFEPFYERRIAIYRRFFERRPGLRELWFDRRASTRVQMMHAHYRHLLAHDNREITSRYVHEPGELFDHAMHVEELSSLWELAFRLDRRGHPTVINEIRELGRDLIRRLGEDDS